MIEKIKKVNRTLLELQAGIVFVGIICELLGLCFVKEKGSYSLGLWIGVILAFANAFHMWWSLDRNLSLSESAAVSKMIRANVLRYIAIVVVMVIVITTKVGNPLAAFLGIMSIKVAAYLQPITHKLSNKIFNETDPIPQSLEELEMEKNQEIR